MYIPRPAKLLFQIDDGWSKLPAKHGEFIPEWTQLVVERMLACGTPAMGLRRYCCASPHCTHTKYICGSVALRSRQITCCFFLRCYLTMQLIRKAFKRLHYPVDIIAQCVRWYLAYSLSLRNLEEIMAERGITVDHSTLHRWIIRLVPLLDKAFRRHKRAVGRRWRMDETYIRVRGQWKYLYRAVDTEGQTIDFLLTAKRDTAAALRFFRKAIRQHGEPEVVTIDKSGANTAALATINANKSEEEIITIRQNKHLNNLIEQDHRNIKRRIRLMLGFKSFRRAQTLLAGIELINMIRKGQYQHPQSDGLSPAEQFYLLAA